MQHLDEGTIHAWLDGELPLADRESAELHTASCAECTAAVAEARGFIAASSRILTALDAVPGGVLPGADRGTAAQRDSRAARRFTVRRAWMAAAAVLVLGIGTVIARRPHGDVAAVRVAEERAQAKPTAVATNGAPATAAKAEPSAAPPATSAVAARDVAPAPPVADEKRLQAANELSKREAPAPKDAPEAFADSAPRRALALNEAVVPSAGGAAAGAVAQKSADSAPPRVVSRTSAITGGDSVVTTIYDVHGVRVSLTERRSVIAPQRSDRSSFSDAVMAKARAAPPVEHSITWSDSTGRTRTLRGAMTEAELERLKAELFGATP